VDLSAAASALGLSSAAPCDARSSQFSQGVRGRIEVIANLTHRPDSAWRSLEPLEIYRSQSWATAIYRTHLAERVERLGYCIELTGRRGEWELVGYTREQIMEFSNRRQDIERELERRGLRGATAAQNVAHGTQLAKDHRDEATQTRMARASGGSWS
jgi:conjugative relaxase-like TrwC/TraI family protein